MIYKLLTVVSVWEKKLKWNNILSSRFRASYFHVNKNPICLSVNILHRHVNTRGGKDSLCNIEI